LVLRRPPDDAISELQDRRRHRRRRLGSGPSFVASGGDVGEKGEGIQKQQTFGRKEKKELPFLTISIF